MGYNSENKKHLEVKNKTIDLDFSLTPYDFDFVIIFNSTMPKEFKSLQDYNDWRKKATNFPPIYDISDFDSVYYDSTANKKYLYIFEDKK